jgi:hypothetical protein
MCLIALAGFALFFLFYLAGMYYIVHEFLNSNRITYQGAGAAIITYRIHKKKIVPFFRRRVFINQ